MESLQCNSSWLSHLYNNQLRFAAGTHSLRRTYTMCIAICAVLTTTTAAADYPERPVRVIVASGAGGGADVGTRIVAGELSRQTGKQFIVDNRPGATGLIGTELIVRATPDGYTIGQGNTGTLATNRSILPKLPYDPDRDIQFISQYAVTPNILVVAPSLPVKSVRELIDHARKNPGKLLFASNGNGGLLHLTGELFKRMTGTQIIHVPYKTAPQAITDLIGGQVHLMFDNASSATVHVKAERVRGIAVTTSKRIPAFPDLPTVAESGVPNFEVVTWGGFIAPSGVTPAIINRLNLEINKALATAVVKEKFGGLGLIPTGSSPEEFAAHVRREVVKWTEVIKGANIKAD